MWETIKPLESSDHFLTNLRAEYEPLVVCAAKETGFDIYVSGWAKWPSGFYMPTHVEVRTREHRDHTPFWNRFDELRRGVEA